MAGEEGQWWPGGCCGSSPTLAGTGRPGHTWAMRVSSPKAADRPCSQGSLLHCLQGWWILLFSESVVLPLALQYSRWYLSVSGGF